MVVAYRRSALGPPLGGLARGLESLGDAAEDGGVPGFARGCFTARSQVQS